MAAKKRVGGTWALDDDVAGLLAKNLLQALNDKDWRPRDLHLKSGVDEGWISKALSGKKKAPTAKALRAVEEALGIASGALLDQAFQGKKGTSKRPSATSPSQQVEDVLDDFPWPSGLEIPELEAILTGVRTKFASATVRLPPSIISKEIRERLASVLEDRDRVRDE